jgi:hypothetical protein
MGRALGFIGLLIAVAVGAYLYMRQAQSVSPDGETANPRATVDMAGVRNDLLNIAKAEKGFFALEGRYATLDELRKSKSLSMDSDHRGPWEYSVETDATSFRVVATYTGPPIAGVPGTMWIDENMNISKED